MLLYQSAVVHYLKSKMDILELRIAVYNKIIRLFPILFFVFLLLPSQKATAVGGISNSKVIVPSAQTVPKKQVEIEPAFELIFKDDEDNTEEVGAGVRFTLGVLDNLEVGLNVGGLSGETRDLLRAQAILGNTEAGLKYRFIDEGEKFPFSLAYQGGFTVPTGSSNEKWIFEPAGLILTKDFTETFSMDADIVLALVENDSIGFVADIGFGYFIRPWFQPVIEAGFSFEDPEDERSNSAFNVTAGFTAPISDMFTLIIGVTPDLYARNLEKQILITAALTILF